MTTPFLKTACRITGEDFDRLQKSTPASRRKVQAFGMAVLIPTAMWMMFTFLLGFSILANPWYICLIMAACAGFIVFSLERLIVMSNGHRLLTIFRMAIGVCIAWLGALVVDQVIFKADVDQAMSTVKHQTAMDATRAANVQFNERNAMAQMESDIGELRNQHKGYQQSAIDEASGLAGSGRKGAGSATRYKDGVAKTALQQLQAKEGQYQQLLTQRSLADSLVYNKAVNDFNPNSLLLRIKAMHLLLDNDSAMKQVYWGFTIFMFLLEFLVIIFKLTWKPSAYDYEVAMIEKLHRERTSRLLGQGSPHLEPAAYHPVAMDAQQSIRNSLNTLL